MDEKTLYIIIGVIVVINVFFMFIAISRKKTAAPSAKAVQQTAAGSDRDQIPVDEHAKTEVLGRGRKSAPAPAPQSLEVEMGKNISNFSAEEKNAIKNSSISPVNETVLLTNANATQLLVPNSESEPVSVIRYLDNGETKEFPIYKESIVIGREPGSCDLTLANDNFVGRTHAILYEKGDKFYLADLNSKNGTFINNQPLKGQKEIFYDTKIRVGKTELELVKK